MKLLSICIPNYNRIEKLNHLVSKVINNIKKNNLYEKVEICISDDCSFIDPSQMIQNFCRENPMISISYSRNSYNMGMDYNFLKSVLMASSDYCWIIGNDDLPTDNGIIDVIDKIESLNISIDIIVTPFNCYDYSNTFIRTIYPLGCKMSEEIFITSSLSVLDNLIKRVQHNSALFGFLSNVIFKRKRWIEHINKFHNKMDSIFIQMYMNIQTLIDGAYYLYFPVNIICNYLDNETNETLDRKYRIAIGLYNVIIYFFKSEHYVYLQKVIVDEYISAVFWELPENNPMREKIISIPSAKNQFYKKYFVVLEERLEKFSGKEVIIYGAGSYGYIALKKLQKYNAKILGFCDRDDTKLETQIEQYLIFDFNKLLQLYFKRKCIIIVANNKSLEEIINKLILNNISDIAIIT